jgi:hypothetical protein
MAKMPSIIAGLALSARLARTAVVLVLVTMLGGCAGNLTGFEFPSFGLMSNFSNDEQADLSNPGSMNSQSLSSAGGI